MPVIWLTGNQRRQYKLVKKALPSSWSKSFSKAKYFLNIAKKNKTLTVLLYSKTRVTFACYLLVTIFIPGFHGLGTQLKVQHGYRWRNRHKPRFLPYYLTCNIRCCSLLNTQARGTSHPVLLLRDHQRFGVEKGASPEKEEEDLQSWGLSSCFPSSKSGAKTPPHVSHLWAVTAPAAIFLDFPPNKHPFAIHLPKANTETSAPEIASELRYTCKTNLGGGGNKPLMTNNLASSEILILSSYNVFFTLYYTKPTGLER